MIKNETVPVIICKRNKKRYDDLGYKCNIGDTINVQILHLSKGCKIDIDVICDKCNKEKIIKFNSLFKNNYLEKYICEKCKREENLMKKYGVKNVFQFQSFVFFFHFLKQFFESSDIMDNMFSSKIYRVYQNPLKSFGFYFLAFRPVVY